jgi:hypothetical protein
MKKKLSTQIEKLIEACSSITPKIQVVPINRTKDEQEKAELLEKLIVREWYLIDGRIQDEIVRPMVDCFLYGKHRWIGCGEKDKHTCRRCGMKASIIYDPEYGMGIRTCWNKKK